MMKKNAPSFPKDEKDEGHSAIDVFKKRGVITESGGISSPESNTQSTESSEKSSSSNSTESRAASAFELPSRGGGGEWKKGWLLDLTKWQKAYEQPGTRHWIMIIPPVTETGKENRARASLVHF